MKECGKEIMKLTWLAHPLAIGKYWVMVKVNDQIIMVSMTMAERVRLTKRREEEIGYVVYHIDELIRELANNHDSENVQYNKALKFLNNHPEYLFDPLWNGIIP